MVGARAADDEYMIALQALIAQLVDLVAKLTVLISELARLVRS